MISHPPVWFKPELVKSDKALEDAELKELLTKPLRESKKAKKKAKAELKAKLLKQAQKSEKDAKKKEAKAPK